MTQPGQVRQVIVNADDFGISAGVNRGILEAHCRGIVTSASLMVRGAAAGQAADLSQQHPKLGVGLHVDLAEWAVQDGVWVPLYEVVDCKDPVGVREEVHRQLESFRELMGGDPTHLDSHQHVHRDDPLRSILLEVAHELSVPLRHFSEQVTHSGLFYGQMAKGEPMPEGISPETLIGILKSLGPGVTELGCHPGFDDTLNTMYRLERRQEVASLCDERVLDTVRSESLELVSFANLSGSKTGSRSRNEPEEVHACEN